MPMELRLVVSVTISTGSAEKVVPTEISMASFNDVLISSNDVFTSGSDVLLMLTKAVSLLFRSPSVFPVSKNSKRTFNKTQNAK